MHKISPQNTGNGIKESVLLKISRGSMPLDPLALIALSALVGQTDVCPPKISKPIHLWERVHISATDLIIGGLNAVSEHFKVKF